MSHNGPPEKGLVAVLQEGGDIGQVGQEKDGYSSDKVERYDDIGRTDYSTARGRRRKQGSSSRNVARIYSPAHCKSATIIIRVDHYPRNRLFLRIGVNHAIQCLFLQLPPHL